MSTGQKSDRRGKWNGNDLKEALIAIKTQKLSGHKASRQYGIPRRTLRRYIQANLEVKSKLGNRFTLTDDQNSELCAQLLTLADKGYPITTKLLRTHVYNYCEQKKIKHSFSTEKKSASYKWVRNFMKKNPQFTDLVYKAAGRYGYDPNLIPAEDYKTTCSLDELSGSNKLQEAANTSSLSMNEQLGLNSDMPNQDLTEFDTLNENQSPADSLSVLSNIPGSELHQHAMSFCESLLAEFSSKSEEESTPEQMQSNVKSEDLYIKSEDSCNEDNCDDDDVDTKRSKKNETILESLGSKILNDGTWVPLRRRNVKWTENTLQDALRAMKYEHLSCCEAARKFNIPRTTLRRYSEINSDKRVPKTNRHTFDDTENEMFCTQLRDLTDQGYKLTANFLTAFVFKFCEQNGIKHFFSSEKKTASDKWLGRFLQKNPEIVRLVHKNSTDKKFVPKLDDVVPYKTINIHEDVEGVSTSMVGARVYVNCESPFNSESEQCDREATPEQDPLEIPLVSEPIEKKKYVQWSQEDLDAALNEIRSKKLSAHKAAQKYEIPRSTLRRYLSLEYPLKCKIGNRSLLSDKQSLEVSAELLNFSNEGHPITVKFIKTYVYNYCEKNRIVHRFPRDKKIASYKWVRGFLKKHPEIAKILQKTSYIKQDYDEVIISDEDSKPTLDECKLESDEDSSNHVRKSSTSPKTKANAQTSLNKNSDEISFPESIGLFEMVSGMYAASPELETNNN